MKNCKNPNWLYEPPQKPEQKSEQPFDLRLEGSEIVARCGDVTKRVDIAPLITEILMKLRPPRRRGGQEKE